MTRSKTSIVLSNELKRLVRSLQDLTGMSLSDLVAVGLLNLLAQHNDALQWGGRRHEVLAKMRTELESIFDR